MERKEIKLSRTDLLDKTAGEWHSGNVVIENFMGEILIEEFAEQMSSMKRTFIEDKNGKKDTKAEWIKVAPDHFRHADAYNWIAYEIGTGSSMDIAEASNPMTETQLDENIFQESDFFLPEGALV